MKRFILISALTIGLGIIGFWIFQMYQFAGGVIEDTNKHAELLNNSQPIIIEIGEINQNSLRHWLEFHSVKRVSFKEIENLKFELTNEYPIDYSTEFPELFKRFISWNQDSTLGCDMDSYSLVLEEGDSGNLISSGGEIDSKVQIISLEDKSVQEIMFCGTNCIPELAQWNNPNELTILGLSYQDTYYPTLWTFNLRTLTKKTEISEHPTMRKPSDYSIKFRLKEINFK